MHSYISAKRHYKCYSFFQRNLILLTTGALNLRSALNQGQKLEDMDISLRLHAGAAHMGPTLQTCMAY